MNPTATARNPAAAPTTAAPPAAGIAAALFAAYDRHDLEALRRLHHPDARITLDEGDDVGLDAWLATFARVLAVLPDLRIRTPTLVADDRKAMAEVRLTGTNTTGLHLGAGDRAVLGTDAEHLPATGRSVAITVPVVVSTADGLVTGERHFWPRFWLYEALRLVTVAAVPTGPP